MANIIIADSSKFTRTLLRKIINRHKENEIIEIENISSFIEAINTKNKTDLVFLDMENQNVSQLIKIALQNHSRLKIVVMMTEGQEMVTLEAIRAGAIESVKKPFKVEDVDKVVEKLL